MQEKRGIEIKYVCNTLEEPKKTIHGKEINTTLNTASYCTSIVC